MKVPPPPPDSGGKPKLTYDKDRTITRRTVKGAAGGMLGVDYEDTRRPDPTLQRTIKAEDSNKNARTGEEKRQQMIASDGGRSRRSVEGSGEGKDEAYVIQDDENAPTSRKRKRMRHVARDRLQVDKDAPEKLRRPNWDTEDESSDFETEDEQVIELFAEDALAADGAPSISRAHLFDETHRPEPGDLDLVNPDEIQRKLGSPASYAKHVMILAEAFRRSTGASRAEAVAYLGSMFVSLRDRSFGRVSLKEFGPTTGILDVYPLEVVEHILQNHPGFLPKVGFGRLFRRVEDEQDADIEAKAGQEIRLEYPADLKIRGFALKGGGRPGYVFEPGDEPGHYRLVIQSAGRFELLISATNRAGYTVIDRVTIEIRGRARRSSESSSTYPVRDESKVRAWPMPEPPVLDPMAAFEASTQVGPKRNSKLLSAAELAWRKAADAMGEGTLAAGPFRIDDEEETELREAPAPSSIAEPEATEAGELHGRPSPVERPAPTLGRESPLSHSVVENLARVVDDDGKLEFILGDAIPDRATVRALISTESPEAGEDFPPAPPEAASSPERPSNAAAKKRARKKRSSSGASRPRRSAPSGAAPIATRPIEDEPTVPMGRDLDRLASEAEKLSRYLPEPVVGPPRSGPSEPIDSEEETKLSDDD